MPQIHFNGKIYNDLAEMPATEREMYDQLISVMRDEDGNGVPDIFEGDVVSNIIEVIKKSGYGDSEGVSALEQMSPEMRARLSKGIAMLNEFGLLSEMREFSKQEQAPNLGRCGNPPFEADHPVPIRDSGGKRYFTRYRSGYPLSVTGHLRRRGSGIYHFWPGLLKRSTIKG